MLRNKILMIVLTIAILTSLNGISFAADVIPVLPELKLSVEQSPLTIYPPIIIYKAQLSYVPVITASELKVDFYNTVIDTTNVARLEYLGSAPVDPKTGIATLSTQIKPGAYTAISKTIINKQTIWSNKIDYKPKFGDIFYQTHSYQGLIEFKFNNVVPKYLGKYN